jgi:hypothetical protein
MYVERGGGEKEEMRRRASSTTSCATPLAETTTGFCRESPAAAVDFLFYSIARGQQRADYFDIHLTPWRHGGRRRGRETLSSSDVYKTFFYQGEGGG